MDIRASAFTRAVAWRGWSRALLLVLRLRKMQIARLLISIYVDVGACMSLGGILNRRQNATQRPGLA